jgi:hypothetical protein
MDTIKSDLLDVANSLASKMNDKSLTAWMKEGQAKDYLKKWNDDITQKTDDLQDKQRSIQEALTTEDEIIKGLAEGPYQDAARETFDEFRSTFTDGMKLLFDRTKDAEDQMRL